MQRKQEAAMKRKVEAIDNIAPRQMPALVQQVYVDGAVIGTGILCEADDWNRMTKVRTELKNQGS